MNTYQNVGELLSHTEPLALQKHCQFQCYKYSAIIHTSSLVLFTKREKSQHVSKGHLLAQNVDSTKYEKIWFLLKDEDMSSPWLTKHFHRMNPYFRGNE